MDFYKEIAQNKRRTFFLIILFIILIIIIVSVIGFFYGGSEFGIQYSIIFGTIAFIISLIFSLISYYHGDKIALSISKARPLKKEEYPYYWHTIEALAIGNGMPKPKPYVIDDPHINAFATGKDPEHSSVAVTTGALEKLNRQELEAVLAHELSHIKNYDIRVMMISAVLVGIVVMISDIFIRSLWFGAGRRRNRDSGGGGQVVLLIVGLVLAILAPLFAQLIKMAISRKREYLADASGAKLTRYPKGLANALRKIKQDSIKQKPKFANKSTAHMFLSNPFKKGLWSKAFSTHPPIDERIKKLEAM